MERVLCLKTLLEETFYQEVIPFLDCWQSVFLLEFSRDYEARHFSLKRNGIRHGYGTAPEEKLTADSSHVFEGIHTCQK